MAKEEDTVVTEELTTEEITEETAEKPTKRQERKVVRRRKSKKEKEKPLTHAIRLAVESGKVEFGARTGVVASLLGKATLFVVAENTPEQTKSKVIQYSKESKIPVIVFEGSTMDLGSVCGKPFPISVLSVYDVGTSNILSLDGIKNSINLERGSRLVDKS